MVKPTREQLGGAVRAAQHAPDVVEAVVRVKHHGGELRRKGKSKWDRTEHSLHIISAVAAGALALGRAWKELHPNEKKSDD